MLVLLLHNMFWVTWQSRFVVIVCAHNCRDMANNEQIGRRSYLAEECRYRIHPSSKWSVPGPCTAVLRLLFSEHFCLGPLPRWCRGLDVSGKPRHCWYGGLE